MRNFLNSHWKVILAILLAIVLAVLTVETGSTPPLAARLQRHVAALVTDTAQPPHGALSHIRNALVRSGYTLDRHHADDPYPADRMFQVSLSNLAPGAAPKRLFIVGARLGVDGNPGAAVVLELARALRQLRLAHGTEVRFVFFEDDGGQAARADSANFMAFIGSHASMVPVRHALAALRSDPVLTRQGLATPAHVMGVTSYGHAGQALVITDTGFLRYPYFRTADELDDLDYDTMAHVVEGLARTLGALAGAAEA